MANFVYFGELGLISPIYSLRRGLQAWGSLRGSEAWIQVGLQVASEPQAAEGDLANKFPRGVDHLGALVDCLGENLASKSNRCQIMPILGSWA